MKNNIASALGREKAALSQEIYDLTQKVNIQRDLLKDLEEKLADKREKQDIIFKLISIGEVSLPTL